MKTIVLHVRQNPLLPHRNLSEIPAKYLFYNSLCHPDCRTVIWSLKKHDEYRVLDIQVYFVTLYMSLTLRFMPQPNSLVCDSARSKYWTSCIIFTLLLLVAYVSQTHTTMFSFLYGY